MRFNIAILAAILLSGFAYALWDYYAPAPSSNTAELSTAEIPQVDTKGDEKTNDIVPNVTFTDLDGKSYRMHDFKGKTLLINMWATWCPPCIEEFPSLLELAETKKDNLVFIAFSSDRNVELIHRFFNGLDDKNKLRLKNDNVIIVHDKDAKISYDTFQSFKYPETFIVDKNLKIRTKISGGLDWMSDGALDLLSKVE